MSLVDIQMPQMGESVTTGTITRYSKDLGDVIEKNEILMEISTDKVESEIPSPVKGKIVEFVFNEGETAPVGEVVVRIDTNLEADVHTCIDKKEEIKEVFQKKDADISSNSNSTSYSGTKLFTPLVKKMAKQASISLNQLEKITGTGLAGRVNRKDFEEYISSMNKSSNTRIKISTRRKTIANNLFKAKLEMPHVYMVQEINFTSFLKKRVETNKKYTYTHLIISALANVLPRYPLLFSRFLGDEIENPICLNLGVAVSVPPDGLLLPVIKNLGSKNLDEVSTIVKGFGIKSKENSFISDDLLGANFAVTNVGAYGTDIGIPIIPYGMSAILAVGAVKKKVIVSNDDTMKIAPVSNFTLSWDHRIVDGEYAGKFLKELYDEILKG